MKRIVSLYVALAFAPIVVCAQQPAPKVAGDPQAAMDAAMAAMNSSKYDKALAQLDQVMASKSSQLDAAMYWSAYAKSKLGENADALRMLGDMDRDYPDSKWSTDAKALALQMKVAGGQWVRPSSQPNDDLKLLAINGLMQNDAAAALPLLEKVVSGNASDEVKSRALFVIAQNGSPAGIAELVRIAESSGAAGPSGNHLGEMAVRYLGMSGGSAGHEALAGIYASTSDVEVKRSILRSYMQGNDRAHLLAAAKSEASPELRGDAIRYLGMSGDSDDILQIAQGEKDPKVRSEAIRALAMGSSKVAAPALVSLYLGASDRSSSRAVINGLFQQGSATEMVGLARKEADPELKRDLVQRLAMMHNKVATDYMLEILNQP